MLVLLLRRLAGPPPGGRIVVALRQRRQRRQHRRRRVALGRRRRLAQRLHRVVGVVVVERIGDVTGVAGAAVERGVAAQRVLVAGTVRVERLQRRFTAEFEKKKIDKTTNLCK